MSENKTVAFPNYIPTRTQQVDFGGGLNGVGAPHLVGAGEVASTTNIDYSLEWGGAPCRRGCTVYAWEASHGVSSINIQLIARNYSLSTGTWNDQAIPWYAAADSGVTYSGSGTNTLAPIALASVVGYAGGAQTSVFPVASQYGSYIYVANGTSAFKSNGASTFDWILPQADTPTVTFGQTLINGTFVGFSGTWTASEGSISGTSTSSYFGNAGGVIISTATTGAAGLRITLIGTLGTNTAWENHFTSITLPTGTTATLVGSTATFGGGIDFHAGWPNGDISGASGPFNGTATITQDMNIGPYGTDFMLLGLANQQSIVSVQRDLSIGDATFTNYWHFETQPSQLQDVTTNPGALLAASQSNSALDAQTAAINLSRASSLNVIRSNTPLILPVYRTSISKTATATPSAPSPWGVSRRDYQFIGTLQNPTFENIQAIRIVIEYNTPGQQIAIGGLVTWGAKALSLNDQSAGISYYQTYARVENNIIVAEGPPSVATTPTKAQYAAAGIVCVNSTNTTAGITHRVFYRTGGLLQDAYRVGSCTITSGTATIYDYYNPDMTVINRPALRRFIWGTWPGTSAGIGLPGVNCLSEPWYDRMFIGVQNFLYWTYPGQPSQINDASQTTVGDVGDSIQGLIPYGNLIIVKQASVYEMAGSVFEGLNQDWAITKSGSRRGSAAPKTVIKTPYGVLLFSYDGISMYRAGYGIDQDLAWVYDKIGDAWKGNTANDPAAFKGRIPAINQSAIFTSCAAYKDEKIYLAVPTGTNTLPNTVFILDYPRQKVWVHTYPFNINYMYWDRVTNRIMAGTDKGTIMQLEIGLVDNSPTNVAQGISWSFQTRTWSTPTDTIMESMQVESVGTITASATVDQTISALNTFTATSKIWNPCTVGVIADAVNYTYNGTQSGTQQEVYQMQWDMIPQAPKVTFFLTDFVAPPAENYVKTWLVDIDTLGTASVTATLLVNGAAATLANGATNTVLSGAAKKVYEVSLQNPTVAKVLQASYKSNKPFKYYDTNYEFETKPYEKITWLVTYKKLGGVTQLDMARFYAMDIEGTLTATVTSTWIIDGAVFTTNTFTLSAANAGEISGVGRMYADQIPFPPGARGYLFQQQLSSSQPFRVWKAHMDIDRIGVKGLSRLTLQGTPSDMAREKQTQ